MNEWEEPEDTTAVVFDVESVGTAAVSERQLSAISRS